MVHGQTTGNPVHRRPAPAWSRKRSASRTSVASLELVAISAAPFGRQCKLRHFKAGSIRGYRRNGPYGHGPPFPPYVGPNTIRRECFMDKKDGHIVETAVEARGGRLGRPVLVVLIISLVTLIGIFAVIYYGSFG
jgi:hypothetical protein